MSEGTYWPRRLALIALPTTDLIEALCDDRVMLKLEGVPPDFVVMGVAHDYSRDVFLIKLSHPSFPVVPEGCEIPRLGEISTKIEESEWMQNARLIVKAGL